MAELADLLDLNLARGLREPDAPGFSYTELISERAELLSGRSRVGQPREYKSARRQALRWYPSPEARRRGIKPRTPSPASRLKLDAARRQQNNRIRAFRAKGGLMALVVSWYGDRAAERLPRRGWIDISPARMRAVVHLWASVDIEEAADELFRAFLRGYHVANPTDWLADVEILELELEPAR